jgi:hypothetical protein
MEVGHADLAGVDVVALQIRHRRVVPLLAVWALEVAEFNHNNIN